MIDGHIHLEYGPLTVEYVMEFAEQAKKMGLHTIQILDHTHRFKEFEPMYESLKKYPEQKAWLENPERKFKFTLSEYISLIDKIREMDLGIEILFGLEVCYTPDSEEFIRNTLAPYRFDFLVGSVHSIWNILYDMSFSENLLWSRYSADEIYKEYYRCLLACVRSGLFTQLGHPDTIKMFNIYPSYDLTDTYRELAKVLKEYGVKAECNTGCHYRYSHKDIGLSDELLKILIQHDVDVITASDAHYPEHAGMFVAEASKRVSEIKNSKYVPRETFESVI